MIQLLFKHPLRFGVAKWDGHSWSNLKSGGLVPVYALVFDNLGNLYAGADAKVAKWNGSSWSFLGSGMNDGFVLSLVFDKAGNLYAGGGFSEAGGVDASNIAKWNGSSWSALGSGINVYKSIVSALAIDKASNLYVGGGFSEAGGFPSSNIAKWKTSGSSYIPTHGNPNCDDRADLADAILALRILAGVSVTETICLNADVNGDGKIGLEEVIYILQKVAGLR